MCLMLDFVQALFKCTASIERVFRQHWPLKMIQLAFDPCIPAICPFPRKKMGIFGQCPIRRESLPRIRDEEFPTR